MTKKIFQSILLASAAMMLACITLFTGVLYNYFGDLQAQQLQNLLHLAAAGVEMQGISYLQSAQTDSCRLTLIDSDGTVLYDSVTDPAAMENHAQRQEIAQALVDGTGQSARYSATLTQQTRYFAQLLSNQTVLRVSVSRRTVWALVLSCLQPLCTIAAVALIVSAILANRLSRNIVRPLEAIDLDQPLEGDSYVELAPLLGRLEQQHRQIRSQQSRLEKSRQEFCAVVGSMTEGLVLLNTEKTILSINPAAQSFFGASEDFTGRHFVDLERDAQIGKSLEAALTDGHSELTVSRSGREYRLRASRVPGQGQPSGVVLLIFDVTEQVFAERNRREFTANVSHELKTPLQSIMGCAELMENGLVRTEDVPKFLSQIRTQSARLVSLIDDIIRLSQLDEKAALPVEEIDLPKLITQQIQILSGPAQRRQISIQSSLEPLTLTAPRPLVQEIVNNLLDNAIKYNLDGGSVTVRCARQDNTAVLCVEDTGIGIPPEHQSRIFERFYRVDKSHSRQIGGTGLGLSIVKHAVLDLNGNIALSSCPGKGTAVTVTLPLA